MLLRDCGAFAASSASSSSSSKKGVCVLGPVAREDLRRIWGTTQTQSYCYQAIVSIGVQKPPSSGDVADVVDELADVEGVVDVEDGIDWTVDGPPNSSVTHAGFRQWHSSSASYP